MRSEVLTQYSTAVAIAFLSFRIKTLIYLKSKTKTKTLRARVYALYVVLQHVLKSQSFISSADWTDIITGQKLSVCASVCVSDSVLTRLSQIITAVRKDL